MSFRTLEDLIHSSHEITFHKPYQKTTNCQIVYASKSKSERWNQIKLSWSKWKGWKNPLDFENSKFWKDKGIEKVSNDGIGIDPAPRSCVQCMMAGSTSANKKEKAKARARPRPSQFAVKKNQTQSNRQPPNISNAFLLPVAFLLALFDTPPSLLTFSVFPSILDGWCEFIPIHSLQLNTWLGFVPCFSYYLHCILRVDLNVCLKGNIVDKIGIGVGNAYIVYISYRWQEYLMYGTFFLIDSKS